MNKGAVDRTGLEVAVIGMAGRFPGARNIDQFWDNIKNKVESITFFSDRELLEAGVKPGVLTNPDYIKAKGMVEDIEYFDASFFEYTPVEAEIMNPQLRIFYECAWEALENAGCAPDSYDGTIGLYAGASSTFHWEGLALLSGKSGNLGHAAAGNLTNKDFLSTTVSYKLNLKGPSAVVQTACSTSLVALHWACRAVLSGECNIALAGGVSITIPQKSGYLYQEGMVMSPDGHCRAFDAKAKGTIAGDGAGVVVLKRLKNAAADGDFIYAVIKGSALNNDGKRKAGYAAPSVKGQAEVIRTALAMARVEPESIGYIETHGTGTKLGDPVEIEGLKLAFNTGKKGFCAIGSVKANIGHLDSAAGVAGFVKTVLALKHKLIPPSLHFETPNPEIDFENSPFYVNTGLKEWKSEKYPLRAGVSSFGIGGTNAHVVLEEARVYHESTTYSSLRDHQLILLSAKSQSALDRMAVNLADHFKANPGINLTDAAYTLQVGRSHFKYRKSLVCSTIDEAVDALVSRERGKNFTGICTDKNRPVVFMFSGLGSQYVNMGLGLYQEEPLFRDEMNRCFGHLESLMDYDLKEILYPGESNSRGTTDINRAEFSQPVIFMFEYALASLLMKWGITPQAMIGYSFGEYVAACISGIFSLEDALKLVVARGKLIQKMQPGAMLSVPLPIDELLPFISGEVSIAIDNGPSCIVAGPVDAVFAFEKQMKERKILCFNVPASHAIHTPMMKPAAEEFERVIARLPLNKPGIPYISNVTGTWIDSEDVVKPSYWAKHLSHTVRFADGMKELVKKDNAMFIEIGPGQDLSALAVRYIEKNPNQKIINPVRHPQKDVPDTYFLIHKMAQIWLYGNNLNWREFHNREKMHRIPLPTYPFERQRFWIDHDPFNAGNEQEQNSQKTGTPGLSDWFYLPGWKRSIPGPRKNKHTSVKCRWLVFTDDSSLGNLLVKKLKEMHQEVVVVKKGDAFKIVDKDNTTCTYTIRTGGGDSYEDLFKELNTMDLLPDKIVHLWNVTGNHGGQLDIESVDDAQYPGFFSLLYIAKALGNRNQGNDVHIFALSDYLCEVTGKEPLCPEKSTVLGLLKVIPQEYPGIRCSSIDIELPEPGSLSEMELSDKLLMDFMNEPIEMNPVFAYRNNRKWVQVFEPFHLERPGGEHPGFKNRGVYMITGGLGEIGLAFSELLVKHAGARLILTGRSEFPAKDKWTQWLDTHTGDQSDPVSIKIKKLQKLEALGGRILYKRVDIADLEKMREVAAQVEKEFGEINGLIHLAGVPEGRSIRVIQDLSENDCREQFQAKVYGVMVLAELFKDRELDFCWMFSSIACVLGGLGFGAYASANSFMDVFVKKYNRSTRFPWMSLNWDGMDADKSIDAFERIFSLEPPDRMVVSNGGNLHRRINQWIKLESITGKKDIDKEELSPSTPRPNLTNPYVPPRNACEEVIVSVWQTLLGYGEIGVLDNFLELGGDSLKSITMISRIRRELHVDVPITTFFDNPTIQGIAEYISGTTEKSDYIPVEPAEEKEIYPLSAAQKGLYLLQQIDVESIGYNMSYIMVLDTGLDKKRLETAVKKLVERHESLRTSFVEVNGESVQKICKTIDVILEYFQLKPPENGFPSREVQKIIRGFVRPFDMSRAPLLRMGIIEIEDGKSVLMVDMHHIISDGVSLQITLQDFMELYNGMELPALTLQYKDFSEWQNNERTRLTIKKQEEYWLKEFEGDTPTLILPYDYARPVTRNFEGDVVSFELDEYETARLENHAVREEVTMFMLLLAIYNVLLFKLSGQEDIIVGTGTVGRRSEELYPIIGLFINTLPLRNYPGKGKTFKDFMKEVKERTLLAFENQDYRYEELITRVAPTRTANRNPLYDVVIVAQNVDTKVKDERSSEIQTPGLNLKLYDHTNKISKYDMSLICTRVGNRLQFMVEYCTKLFKRETIDRFVEYFNEITRRVLSDDEVELRDITITHHLLYAEPGEDEDQMEVEL